jgi:hypothetical protein
MARPEPEAFDQARLLESLQKTLEMARARIDGLKDAMPGALESLPPQDVPPVDAPPTPPAEPPPEPVTIKLRERPPTRSAPERPAVRLPQTSQLPRMAPAWMRVPRAHAADATLKQPQRQVAKRRFDPIPSDDDEQLEKIFQRLTQRPPATAEELQDVTTPRSRWMAWAGPLGIASLVGCGLAFGAGQFFEVRPIAATASQEQRAAPARVASLSTGYAGAPAKAAPRLLLSSLSGVRNRPVALGVSVASAPPGASIIVRGMLPGSRITAGTQADPTTWLVPVGELTHAAVLPPPNFVGAISLSVDLRQADGRVTDSDVQKLEWSDGSQASAMPKSVSTTVINSPSDAEGGTVGSGSASPDSNVREQMVSPVAAAAGSRQLDDVERENLLRRGRLALENGDISAARLLLQRAAEAGDPQAELALAATFDPAMLGRIGALGASADLEQARAWYQRAADAGVDEAARRLRQLAQQGQ